MAIWFNKNLSLEDIRKTERGNSLEYLGFIFTQITDSTLSGYMEVSPKTIQPLGLFHGGLNCFMGETLGSCASNFCLNNKEQIAVGLNIYTDHLKVVTKGQVTGTARPVHLGRSTHLWEIKTFNEQGDVTSISKLKTFIKCL
ncbi:MAG: hotdog fold thioesterase [Halobacteriovoraceae bacterium]|nr:hotdog fold thioesterase [Halobacteriovoraceae bacterium]